MQNVLLWPYDEVQVDESEHALILTAPWIEVQVEKTEENAPELSRLVKALSGSSLSVDDAYLVTQYFEALDEHYLCYTLPTALRDGLDTHSSRGDLSDLTFPSLATTAVCASTALEEHEKAQILATWEPNHYKWTWDSEAALSFSALGDRVHPQSLFSVARRYHLISLMDNDPGASVFAQVSTLPPDSFQKTAAVLLRQNHYVTQMCESALLPALQIAGRASGAVASFMQDERGHDRILAKALESLAVDPNTVPAVPMTRVLMCLLEFTANRNFLAFAMAVDFFERRIYHKVEPLAELLEQRGFSEAAKRLSQHKHINDAGEHHNTARDLLNWMAPCEPAYAHEALRIAEAVSYTMSQIVRSTFETHVLPA